MSQRSQEKELLDLGPDFYTPDEFVQCQRILFQINKLLGIFKQTIKLIRRFPQATSLADIGCGGGLFLLNLSKHYPDLRLIGIDISNEAITVAQKELLIYNKQNFAQNVEFKPGCEMLPNEVDLILVNLVCHHLDDKDLSLFIQKYLNSARVALIINDLQRSKIAYWFYKFMSPLFKNRLITHDGLISIQRSFTRKELRQLLEKANVAHYQIKWCFPFRWNVIVWKK